MRGTVSCIAMAGAFISLVAFTAQETDARGRGGGARGGGASSMSRGGGGGGGGFNRGGGGGNRAHSGGSFSRQGNYSRPGGGGAGTKRPSQRPSTRPGQGGSGTRNVNRGNINTGDINIDRDVHVDVDNDWNGWGGYYDHPIAAGVAVGAVAGITAAAIGSRYYALPPGCSPYPYSSLTYYSCGNVWYQPSYQGDTVVYVVVDKPG